MCKNLDKDAMAAAANRDSAPRPPEQVEQIVVMARLELWNRSMPCGAPALRRRLEEFYQLKPLPSVRTIGRILARNGLVNW